ncbi:MAG: DUF779 domain-containing protein [Terasakiella sp.]|uniref:DUF779 domain-containing protein n=1 Tax=unclassified Terasakiella TaxID=2614952 RepID=UPI003B003947
MTQLNITPQARDILQKLKAEHGKLIFLISGGCCDGSAPLCFIASEFTLGESDIQIGLVDDTAVYVANTLSDHIKGDDQFCLDVAPGRGGGFSLEAPYGVRFINREQTDCPI